MATRPRPRGPDLPVAPEGDPAHDSSAMQVLRHFRRVFNAVKTHHRLVEKQTGVGGALVWAMSLIDRHPGIGMGELARRMAIHQSTTSNLVKTLIERDMVEGMKEGRDRRAVQLHLLPAGSEVLRRARQPFSGVLHQALESLDTVLLTRLEQDLGTLILALGPPGRVEDVPMLPA